MDTYWNRTTDLVPNDVDRKNLEISGFLSSLLDDKMLKKINPRRFIYYKRYIKTLKDPEIIKKFMYLFKKIKENTDSKDKMYKKIINLHSKLSYVDTKNVNYLEEKKQKIKDISSKVSKILISKMDNKKLGIKQTENIEKMANLFQQGGANSDDSKDYLDKISRKIENIKDNSSDKETTKIYKYKDVLNELDVTINPLKSLEVTKEDRIIFILITFIIRLVSITIVEWSLHSNYINNFQYAFILYTIIYLIILSIIFIIINITFNYNSHDVLYGNTGFSLLANSLYYFYLVPGADFYRNARLFVHIILFILFNFIPLGLKSSTTEDNNIDYNYVKKKETIDLLSKYTFVVWIFTSIVALNY
jgi:hypothetical protein